jgi:hypothetical protein
MTTTDMSIPVTRGELREELGLFRQEIREDIRRSLELWGGALLDRIEQGERRTDERFRTMDERFRTMDERFRTMGEQLEQRLGLEFARHAKAIQESLQVQVSAVDEKYADLPGRVDRLEAVVSPPR